MQYKLNPLAMKKEHKDNINHKIVQLKNGLRYNHKLPSDMEVNCGRIILNILNLSFADMIFNERITIHPFEMDIYIPSKKLAFEIQDKKSHYGECKLISDNNNEFKKDWCSKLNIRLISIPYNYTTEIDIKDLINGKTNKVYNRKKAHYKKAM